MSKAQTGRSASVTRWLLRCGLVAGPAFVIVFSVDGATRPGYRPLRHPVSSLSLGPRGWVQVTNFAVTGALYLAAAAGLARAADPATRARTDSGLVAVAAAGLIGAAAFRTDPVSGYPPGSPDVPARPSRTGTAHNLLSAGVFLGVPAAAFADGWRALRRGRVGWGLYCAGTAMSMLAAMGGGGRGLRPVAAAGQSGRSFPAHEHRDRLRMAHGPVGAGAPAEAAGRGRGGRSDQEPSLTIRSARRPASHGELVSSSPRAGACRGSARPRCA